MIRRAAFLISVALVSTAAAEPQHHWSRAFSGPGLRVDAMAVDPAGNVVIVGFTDRNTNFGNGYIGGSGPDVFAAKFDRFGELLWTRKFNGTAQNQTARSVAIDAQGNVVIVGTYTATIDFGGGPMTAHNLDVFVVKLAADGSHLWSKHFGSDAQFPPGNYGEGVAVDAAGNVIITGAFSLSPDFGGGPMTSLGSHDVFVVKFDPDGNHVWSRQFGAPNKQYGNTVGVDASGNVIVAGTFRSSMLFGSGGVVTSGEDIFMFRLDPNGAPEWIRTFGDGSSTPFLSMAVDPAGNVVASGEFTGWIDFGGGRFTSPPNDVDTFVASLDATGAHRWSVHVGGAQLQSVRGVAFDAFGNVDVTGAFEGTIDLGGRSRTSTGLSDVFAAQLDPSGAFTWGESFGGTGTDLPSGVAVDAEGNLMLAGAFGDAIDFGGGPLYGRSNNVYLTRLGEGSIEPALDISVFCREHALETRWSISSGRPLDHFVVLRDVVSKTEPTIVAAGPIGSGQGTYVDRGVAADETYQYELVVFTPAGVEYRSSLVMATVTAFATQLAQNYPNPFNPATSIAYSVSARTSVAVAIYDATGARVRRIDQGTRDAGGYSVEWNGRDDAGRPVGSGVYFYRLEGVTGVASRKMVLLK